MTSASTFDWASLPRTKAVRRMWLLAPYCS